MYYEVRKNTLGLVVSGKLKPQCIFCGKAVSCSDYFCLCKKHGFKYYSIPKFWRVVLPKFLIKLYIIKGKNYG